MAMRKKYSGSGGGGLGQLLGVLLNSGGGGELEGAALNQPVSPEYQPQGYSGPQQYYSPSGEVVNTPAIDTRNWLRRGLGAPNTASGINTKALMDELEGERSNRFTNLGREQEAAFKDKRFPTELEQAGKTQRQIGQISQEQDLSKQRALQQLALDLGPQLNPQFGVDLQPGQVDPSFAGMPEESVKTRYMPNTTAGVAANMAREQGIAALAEQESQQKIRDLALSESKLPRQIGDFLYNPSTGEFAQSSPVQYKEQTSIDPATGKVTQGYQKVGGGATPVTPFRKPLDRVPGMGAGAGIQPSVLPSEWRPPMLPPANESVAGRVPTKASQFTSPSTTEPSVLAEMGGEPESGYSPPMGERLGRIAGEAGKRTGQKIISGAQKAGQVVKEYPADVLNYWKEQLRSGRATLEDVLRGLERGLDLR